MNKETQNIEWKAVWKDEFLAWIAGFANANGGTLIIGKNDDGSVVGLAKPAKLLEDIPNKVRDTLGIMVDVNLIQEEGEDLIEIKVDPHSYPINYKGQYHYRTGSTKQELKGAALNKFILQKSGKHWDGIPLPSLKITDLAADALDNFKKRARKSKRVDEHILDDASEILLDNLRLMEDHQLKRACALLFHNDPEKFVTGAYIKIGFFESESDLIYQDEIHGNLFSQIEKTMDLLLTKYMSAYIRYEGIARIEEYVYPEAALREALLNAVAHKDYSSGVPIQISVYKNQLNIWNDGHLPLDWTLDTILEKHPSKPANPDIANTFFRAGMVESWGRGISKMVAECKKSNLSVPQFSTDFGGLMVTFNAINQKSNQKSSQKSNQKSNQKILDVIKENSNVTIQELADILSLSISTIKKNIVLLKKDDKLERVGSDKGGHWKVK